MPAKYFSIDGVATYVHHTGPTTLPDVAPDLGVGQVVLCLHGAGGNGNVFARVLERLSEAHSPLAFDMPAHGRSGGLDSLGSIERMADFTRGVIEKLGLRQPVLLGHSMGGAVALQYALTYGSELRGLVLCSSGARFGVTEERLERLRRVTMGRERRAFTRDSYSPSTPPEVLRQGFMEDLKTDPRAGYGDMLACRDWDAEARLGSIEVPTLVIDGEDEAPALVEQAALLEDRIRGARRVRIPKAGHCVAIEQPDALVDAIQPFLAELPQ